MRTLPFWILILVFSFSTFSYSQTTSDDRREIEKTSVTESPSTTNDFKSDGCTMWFNGEYRKCCEAHDAGYFTGAGNWRARLKADNKLFSCVANLGVGYKLVAPV